MSSRVLVVDPDDDTRLFYREALQLARCDVVEASDGRDGLAKALVHHPSVIITEARLPFIDGYALCAILRQDSVTCAVPILVVTAEARAAQLDRIRQAGADAVLVKPAAPDVMLDELCHLMSRNGDGDAALPAATVRPPIAEIRRPALARSYARFTTTTPPDSPPLLLCPACDRVLTYEHSHVSGVSNRHPEQWDYYSCSGACGEFQYRQRTRKLRRAG